MFTYYKKTTQVLISMQNLFKCSRCKWFWVTLFLGVSKISRQNHIYLPM